MHVHLIRHGQSHVNLTDLTQRHADDPLTTLGVDQANAAGEYLANNVDINRIYASTVARALETAEIINSYVGVDLLRDDRLREIGTANADGSPVVNLQPYVPDMWGTLQPYQPVTADGESWMQCRARVGSFIESVVPVASRFGEEEHADFDHKDEHILVVAHAGVIEAVFEYVFEKGPRSVVAIKTNNTGITHLEYAPSAQLPGWWLHAHNRIVHLPPEMLTT